MPSITAITKILAAVLFSGASQVTSMPTASDALILPNLGTIIRAADGSYNHSEAMADIIRSHPENYGLASLVKRNNALSKRDYAIVHICSTASCTDCTTAWDGSFTTASACISATNTNCLIVSNLQNANIEYWSHSGCNGRNTVYKGCPSGTNLVGAPGTQSIGVHPGC